MNSPREGEGFQHPDLAPEDIDPKSPIYNNQTMIQVFDQQEIDDPGERPAEPVEELPVQPTNIQGEQGVELDGTHRS